MKRRIIIIAAVVLVGALGYTGWQENKLMIKNMLNSKEKISDLAFKGRVIAVNSEDTAFDGPYRFVIREDGGSEVTVSVGPRAPRFCAAGAHMADPATMREGMMVEVNGALTSGGDIVPCESSGHYLRVVPGV